MVCLLCIGPGGVLLSEGAHAQTARTEPETTEVSRAREYFHAGAQAYSIGEFAAAVQAFEQAYALAPRPAVLFSIAQAEKRLYFVAHERIHLANAIKLYREYLNADAHAARKLDALQALSELEPLAATLTPAPQVTVPANEVVKVSESQPTRIMIASPAEGAQISVDAAEPQFSPLIREVEPGEHVARVSASGYLSDERRIIAVKGALVTFDVALAELPATVVVLAPAGAELSIDGRLQGTIPFPKPLALAAGAHLISVTKHGYVGWSTERRLARGENATIEANMPRSIQRTTSLLMFGAAASAMTASGIFAYFALGQESSAKSFLNARGNGLLTAADLAEYRSIRSDRDHLRLAALASAGVGLGLAAAGVVLFNFDAKSAPEPFERNVYPGARTEKSNRLTPRAQRFVRAVPELGTGFAGLTLSGAF